MSVSLFRASANGVRFYGRFELEDGTNSRYQVQSTLRARAFASTQAARRGKTIVDLRVTHVPNVPADIVQELYLRELRAYKPAVIVRPHAR